ncbi:MAG: hypothetical protein R3F48_15150 [Candidatus Zixiibacteriota bacterium]
MHREIWEKIKSFQTVLMIVITLGYLLGTHLSTINDLQLALAEKAERSDMELLDKKLTRIEVKLEAAIISREEIVALREHIDRQLSEFATRQQSDSERKHDEGANRR